MLILFLPTFAGGAIGLLRGGRLERLGRLRLRRSALIVLGVALEASLRWTPASLHLGILLATYALLGAWMVANWSGRPRSLRLALGLIAVGACLNVAAIAPSHGMPVSAHALAALHTAAAISVSQGHLYKHVAATAASPLRWLGDAIAVGPLRAVISVGDILLAVGIALFIVSAMGRRAVRGVEATPAA
jgi:hypothetical protein